MCKGAQAHDLIGEHARSALAFKRENGQPTSHPPLGFTANGDCSQHGDLGRFL